MKNILVMGAGGTAGINFIECLVKAGRYNIVGCDINDWHLEILKGKFKEVKTYVSPNCLDVTYNQFINDLIVKENIDFVHAQPDMEVEVLGKSREQIKATTFLPSDRMISRCRDKYITNRMLSAMTPLAYLVDESLIHFQILSIQEEAGNEKVWLRAVRGAGSRAALPVTSAEQALNWIKYWKETKRLEANDFMLSEFLPGKEYAFQSVWKDGELITSMARERVEYLMGNLFPSGQSSSPSVAVTVHNDAVNETATTAIRLLDSDANGVFCIDMKEDVEGRPHVTEVNAGRFFTTSNFFAHFGANMPDTYIQLGLGEEVTGLEQYNALQKDLVWVRGVDVIPYGFALGDKKQ